MDRISTLLASLLVLVNVLGIKALLVIVIVVWRYLLPVTCIILVTGWSRFHKRLLHLVLACWEVCTLMPHKINLHDMGVTCHLLDMPGSHLWTLHLPCKLPEFACRKLVQVYVVIIVLETNSSSFRKNQKRFLWVWIALYHSSTDFFPCWKLVRRSNLALTSLTETCITLQTSPRLCQALALHWTSSRKQTGRCQNHHSKLLLSCITFFQVTSQAHTQGCSHISNTI